jgi:IclR family acetate operon transcriptional repressor
MLGKESLERYTPRTIISPESLRRELDAIRTEGVALDREECEEGATCIATAVRNARGETVAAMSISGPTLRMHPGRIRELTPVVVRAGREASRQLGCVVEAPAVSRVLPGAASRKGRGGAEKGWAPRKA